MVQVIACHSTTESNRQGILDQGLLPHHPTRDGNYQDAYQFLDKQPEGVYIILGVEPDWQWAYGDSPVAFIVDITGMKFVEDPEMGGDHHCVIDRIPPQRFLSVVDRD